MKVRVASAGTGKTTALVLRVLSLIEQGVPLRRIAGVTYTRTAAAELRERVGDGIDAVRRHGSYLGGAIRPAPALTPRFEEAARELGGACLSTIHGFLATAARLVAPNLGVDPDFLVIGEGEAVADFEEELRSLLFLAQQPGDPLAELVSQAGEALEPLTMALFAQRSMAADLRPADEAGAELLRFFEAVMDRTRRRWGSSLLPPAELEAVGVRLVRAPALAARVVARYPVLLVDEYQDVNPLQGALFEALEAAGAQVEVVGDPKQSIYGFRQADVEVFRRAARTAAASGSLEPPLVQTRRHARLPTGLLNHMTATLAEAELGFSVAEAPEVRPAGAQAEVDGAVELHWWRDDDGDVAQLRAVEAAWLPGRLAALHREGRAWSEMAVLARSHASLTQWEQALQQGGVPAVIGRGRGYYQRSELRDLLHALRVALDPRGLSLAAFLRGPFGGLGADAAATVARSAAPEETLAATAPEVAERLAGLSRELRRSPSTALATLAYAPLIDGRPYVAQLPRRARDNVDALVVAFADRPAQDLERLLDRLERMARESEAGDVPQSGEGVALLTVHAAKGLEWPVVAVVDAGRGVYDRPPLVAVDATDGSVALPPSPAFDALERRRKARDDGEAMRALYVAISRPRDHLLVSGSRGRSGPGPWLRAFHRAGLGPHDAGRIEEGWPVAIALGIEVTQHGTAGGQADRVGPGAPAGPVAVGQAVVQEAVVQEAAVQQAAPYLGRVPLPGRYPALLSPSWLALEGAGRAPEPRVVARWPAPLRTPGWDEDDEERSPPSSEEGERITGRGTAVGTLVHDAIARGWRPEDPTAMRTLAAQEVMFPFDAEAREQVLEEVRSLLGAYWSMVDQAVLPPLGARDEDRAELAFAFEAGGSTWHGVIDRLQRVGDRWYLDDYKTDRHLDPLRYHLPMASYVQAVELAIGLRPSARLVDLRRQEVLPVADDDLREAWRRAVGGTA